MVEYVYARHDFIPEHEDEIALSAGERIEVVDRDDLYGDGWWQGRNLEGKVGLFPESYTQPAPPSIAPLPAVVPATAPLSPALADKAQPSSSSLPSTKQSQLEPAQEETRHTDTVMDETLNQSTTATGNGEVMRATLTDVQQAIEQLGHKDDLDGSRSFTFSSSRDESTDRDTDHDTDADVDGDDWHKSARQKLAEKAKKVVEERAARDAIGGRVTTSRPTAPPIDVELSDDSGDEGDGPFGESSPNAHGRKHPHISEEEEVDITAPPRQVDQKFSYSPSIQPSERYIVPSPVLPMPRPESGPIEEVAVATATQSSFPQNDRVRTPENQSSLPSPVSPGLRGISNGVPADAANLPSSAPLVFPSKNQTLSLQEAAGVLPSPAASFNGHRHGYSISSMTSSAHNATSSPLFPPRSADFSPNKKPRDVHPSEWNVEDVVNWLRAKGFDDVVCDMFTEQEITGDVLLELDVGVLKSEIGIVAYGKRIRIANAISELRRPPSVMSSEQPTRSGSLSYGSPLPQQSHSPATLLSSGPETLTSPQSPPELGELAEQPSEPPYRASDPGTSRAADSDVTVGLGLGIPSTFLARSGEGKPVKGRPPQLTLSPSDPALAANAKGASLEQRLMDEDRGVLSDSDTKNVATKGRGHLFGRQNSTSSLPRKSQEVTTPRSDISQLSDGARPRPQSRKRSLDATRENSRLSIFGSTFALAKTRKPPPRYSATPDIDASPDRSALSLTRFYQSSGSRKTSTRSAPDSGADKRDKRASKDSNGTKEKRDSVLMRKPISPITTTATGAGSLKSDRSILEQIGEPDHKGWLRKRGDRYNTWKQRYFVLKGPHLYWLKSGNPSETKIKGYVNTIGYRVVVDENIDPGRYGFKLVHDADRPHFFSSDEQMAVREWMKAFMKATIERDYSRPVVSSVNVPTIPLSVAQAMNPAPRPPSPTARAATQRAMRRENTNQLSTRDAEILMSLGPTTLPSNGHDMHDRGGNRLRIDSIFSELPTEAPVVPSASPMLRAPPVRPPREMRRAPSARIAPEHPPVEPDLIEWANSHLPGTLQISPQGSVCGGLELLRIAESIKGVRGHIAPDSAFSRGPNDDTLEGLFSLFDFLLDNDVKMGMISINDVRQGKRDKIVQLLKALRAWEEKRRAVMQSIGKSSMQAGPFVA